MTRKRNDQGYIAISVVLIVGFILTVIGVGVTMTSINSIQVSLSEIKKETALALTESCAQDALLTINKQNNLDTLITLPEGNCDVTINSHIGTNWSFSVSADVNGYRKKITIEATRASRVTVTSWQEI